MSQDKNNNSLVALKNHLAAQQGLSSSLSLRERKEALSALREENILLLDISGSMAESVDSTYNYGYPKPGKKRIDVLWSIVQRMRSQNIQFKICLFSTDAQWSDAVECPQVEASTDLARALIFILNETHRRVKRITLITDGIPDSANEALDAAAILQTPINVLYVGPDDNSPSSLTAKAFCQSLAAASNGAYAANALTSEMLQLSASQNVRLMLTSGEEKKGVINL